MKEVTRENVGGMIRAARTASGMSQPKLGQAVGVTEQTIAMYEKGQRNVNVMMLYKLAKAMGVSVKSLLP